MRYVGTMQLGIPVVFALTFGRTSIGLEIYPTFYKGDDGKDIVIEPYHLTSKSKTEFKKNCYAHALTDKNFSIRAYFGDENLLHQALKILNTDDLFHLLSVKQINVEKAYVYSSAITIHASYYADTTVRKYPGFDYIEAKAVPKQLSQEMRRHRLRTMEELCKLYDLSFAIEVTSEKPFAFRFKRDYRCITTTEELMWVLENIKNHDKFTFDIETTGTKIYYYGGNRDASDRMIGFGLSWETGQAVYIPLESHVFETLDRQFVIDTLFPVMKHKKFGGANIPFDLRGVYHEGFVFKTWCDVIDNEYLIDPEGSRGHKGLKQLARYYIKEEIPELNEVLGGPVDGNLILWLPKDVLTLYGCSDVEPIWRINEHQQKYMATLQAPMLKDRSVDHIIAQCNYYGAHLDIPKLDIMQRVINKDFQELEKLMYTYLEKKISYLIAKAWVESDLQDNTSFITTVEMDALISEKVKNPLVAQQVDMLLTKKKGKVRERLSFTSFPDVKTILHELLNYPIFEDSKGELSYSVDDEYLEKLIGFETAKGEDFLIADMISCSTSMDLGFKDSKQELILSKQLFKTRVYPFAYMMKAFRKLHKQKTAFCDKLMEESVDGWYCTDYKLTEAATGRIINPVQTVQKFFKHFIDTFPGMYGINADMKQVELRIMNGEANLLWERRLESGGDEFREVFGRYSISDSIERMSIPWADLHRETGCKIFNTTPLEMSKDQRDQSKQGNFAAPYGGSALAVARVQLKGVVNPSERKRIIQYASETMALWKAGNFALNEYLDTVRVNATQPVEDRKLLPPKCQSVYAGDYGIVKNAIGRRRVIDLNYEKIARLIANAQGLVFEYGTPAWEKYCNRMARSIKARIQRESGNHPIQSFCAEMLRDALVGVYNEGEKLGLCGLGPGKEKLIITLLVHDEFTLQVSPEVHPFLIYKLIWDKCVRKIKGHPTYYWGVSAINHWYDGKLDKYDAPVEFMRDMAKCYGENPEQFDNESGWNKDPQSYIQNYIDRYMWAYLIKHCKPYVKDGTFNYDLFLQKDQNYFLQNSMGDYLGELKCIVPNMSRKDMIFIYLMQKCADKVLYKGHLIPIKNFKFEHKYAPAEIKQMIHGIPTGGFSEFDLSGDNGDNLLDDFDFFSSDNTNGIDFEAILNSDVDDNIDTIIEELNEIECSNAADDVSFVDASTYDWSANFFEIDEEYDPNPPKNYGIIQMGDRFVFNATNLKQNTFDGIITYLLQYRDDEKGYPLVVIVGKQEIVMQWKLAANFSNEIVAKFIEEDSK